MPVPADPAKITRRLEALKAARSPHETVWRNCFDFTFPLRGSGFQSTELDAQSGQSKRAELLDGTGTDSGRILASAIMSGATPANSLWMQIVVDQQTDEEGRWFDENTPTLHRLIHSSNFDSSAFESCLDLVAAGWFALYVTEEPETKALQFEEWPLAQVYCGSTKRGGAIDIVYRDYRLTAEQAVEEFDEENVSEQTLKLSKTKPDEWVSFVHAIYPRDGALPGAILATRLPIASCHVEVKAKKLVRESGYHEMPVIVPRWQMLPSSVYGVGPAWDALPDMRMLNTLSFDELANADLAIAGMWIAEDDGVLNARTIKVGPRKVIVANSVDSMKPLTPGGQWQLAEYLVKAKQAAVRKIFMADQLQPQDGPDMTAYEVHVRINLIRQLLGPVYGRLQAEYLQQLVERTFGLSFRAGKFTPAPESLGGRQFHVKYISPLARAQRAEEVTAMDGLEQNLIAQAALKPEVYDNYKIDDAVRERSKLLGVPQTLMRTADEVTELRGTREAARQKAAQDQIVGQGAASFADAKGKRLATA